MKRKVLISLSSAILMLSLSFGLASTSYAANQSSMAAELAKLNPGTSEEEVISNAKERANELGLSSEELLSRELVEARQSATNASRSSSGSDDTALLRDAARKGDIFYSPASHLGITHGHSGIYYTKSIVVEAPGIGQKSHSVSANSLEVTPGTLKQYVKTTQTKRNAAANYAYKNLRGKPYNTVFYDNKYVNASKYNCSQLVWAAYKAAASIDLDGNGGSGVYPADIRDSSLTVTYSKVI